MMIAPILQCLICAAPLFSVQAVPLSHNEAQSFVAMAHDDGIADLFVLDQSQILLYENGDATKKRAIALKPGVSAVDIYDTDADGHGEIFCICGHEIIRYNLAPSATGEAEVLFQLKTQLADSIGLPFLHVLIVDRNERPLLALPCEKTFELRSIQGEIIESHPIGMNAPLDAAFGRPFSVWNATPPQAGGPASLEFRINKISAYQPDLPEDLLSMPVQAPYFRRGTPRQLREAAEMEAAAWPWFPLQGSAESQIRVLYAISQKKSRGALIRIQHLASAEHKTPERISPARQYPGHLILTEDGLPDCNGDGYTDLVLWNSPEPAPTVNTLTKILTRNTWPLRITVHLFDPAKGRYQANPAAYCTTEVPLLWYIGSNYDTPLRNMVLRDLDGDGRTDIACSTRKNSFSVWRYTEKGLKQSPDFHHQFLAPIKKIDLITKLEGGAGGCSLVLRGEKVLFLLRTPLSP